MSKAAPVIPTVADWPLRTVGEMTTLLRRGTAPVYVDESDVMAIGQRCVTDADFDRSRSRPHSAAAMSNVVTPEAGDVLINSTGTGTIGRSVIFRDETNKYIVDGHVTVARLRRTDLIGRWLNDVLRSPAGQRYLESRCYAGSTNQIELSSSALAAMPVAVPCVAEQRRVAEILDTLDERISSLDRVVEKLERCREGFIRDSLGKKNFDQFLPLGSLAEIGAGVTLGSEPNGPGTVARPYLRVANVQDGRLDLEEIKFVRVRVSDLSRFELQSGDVLMNEGGDADKLGRGAVWGGQIPGCLHQNHVFRVRCHLDELNPHYLSLVTGSALGKRYFLAASKQTTNLATINSRQIKQFPVPLRSMPLQLRIVAEAGAFAGRLETERSELAKARLLKSGLMTDFLTGRVRVPEEVA